MSILNTKKSKENQYIQYHQYGIKKYFFSFPLIRHKKKIKLRSISYSLLTPISTRRIG